MERLGIHRFVGLAGAALIVLAAAGCATKPAEVVSAAPPPVVIPPRPRAPLGAQTNLSVPPLDPATGTRRTINSGISPAQTVWNLRSAYNVAALDCLRPEHAGILDGYKAFLKANAKALAAANRKVDAEFAAANGKGRAGTRAREAYMTQVYNFYALPPTLPLFCDAALAMSVASTGLKKGELDAFAAENLPRLDQVFLQFFDSYDQYRADLAAWQARYAPTSPPPLVLPPPVAATLAPSAAPTPSQPAAGAQTPQN